MFPITNQCSVSFSYTIYQLAGFISISQPPKWEKIIQVLSSHCRLCSLLHCQCGKVLQRVVVDKFQTLVGETDFLDPFQSSFRPVFWKRKSSCRMTWTSQWLSIALTVIFSQNYQSWDAHCTRMIPFYLATLLEGFPEIQKDLLNLYAIQLSTTLCDFCLRAVGCLNLFRAQLCFLISTSMVLNLSKFKMCGFQLLLWLGNSGS